MLLHEFGEGLIAHRQLAFQSLNATLLMANTSGGGAPAVQRQLKIPSATIKIDPRRQWR
jgi:hypothetical protein